MKWINLFSYIKINLYTQTFEKVSWTLYKLILIYKKSLIYFTNLFSSFLNVYREIYPSFINMFLTWSFLACLCSLDENNLHFFNKLYHLLPWVQRRRIDTQTIQAFVSNGVKNGDRGPHPMHGGATHVVLHPNLPLLLATIVEHRVLEHRHDRRSQRWRWRQARVLYGLAHQEI